MSDFTMQSKHALWINKDGEFGVMDTVEGKVYKPLIDERRSVRAMRIGTDYQGNAIFTITFIGATDVEKMVVEG